MMRKINFKHHDDALKKQFKTLHSYDLSTLFPNLDEDEKKRLVYLVDSEKRKDIFIELEIEDQLDLLSYLDVSEKKQLLRNLESDDLKEFIASLDDEEKSEIIKLLSKVRAKSIELLMRYDDDLAASVMSTEYLTITKEMTIKEATNLVITSSKDSDYIDTIFVIDDEKKLIGIIDIKDLIVARSTHTLESIMDEDFQFVFEDDSIEKAIQTVVDYDRNAIPVLDHENHLIGVITGDDIFDEIIEDLDYDYQKMALLSDYESSSSAFKRSKQRLPWLMIAVVLNLLIASFLSIFEATIVEVTALILFQPLILGMAGNIGTQALAVTIIKFNVEPMEDENKHKKHIYKEIAIGLFNSIILAILSFIFVYSFLSLVPTGSQSPESIASVVLIAVFASMFISSAMGVLIPITLTKFGSDPSVASGPIMTTINDLVALVIYFGVATLIFLI